MRPLVILGLDIDGIFHPEGCPPDIEWVHLEKFQEAMRLVQEVSIVITSNWRFDNTLVELRSFFAPDIARRIIGVTPNLFREESRYTRGLRQRELEAWVAEHAPDVPWLALDDRFAEFDDECPGLLLVPNSQDGGIGLQFEHLEELERRLRGLVAGALHDTSSENLMTPKKNYVIIDAIDGAGERFALLMKNKGPQHLLGKLTFPGGVIEADDASATAAARRELLEETSIDAPLESFQLVGVDSNDERDLSLVFVVANISTARTTESEVVMTVDITASVDQAKRNPEQYAADFLDIVAAIQPRVDAQRALAAAQALRPGAVRYILPCDYPHFRQSLDRSRPHELLDVDAAGRPTKLPPERRHQLTYRYTDNGEHVLVPNAHYNQTPAMRAAQLRFQAQDREERVARMRTRAPDGCTAWMVENVATRMLANANELRAHADGLLAGTTPFDAQVNLVSESALSRGWAIDAEKREQAAKTSDIAERGADATGAANVRRPKP